jgi:tetrahydromethanopterin S-methyltransferase subunit G
MSSVPGVTIMSQQDIAEIKARLDAIEARLRVVEEKLSYLFGLVGAVSVIAATLALISRLGG